MPMAPDRVPSAAGKPKLPAFRNVERRDHSLALTAQIRAVQTELESIQAERVRQGLPEKVDLILEIDSAPGFPLSADEVHALTTGRDNTITLLHARPVQTEDGSEQTRVLIHVPYGNLPALAEKFRRFAEDTTPKGNVPNPWVANLERIAKAAMEAMWTDSEPLPDDENALHWWQLWIRRFPQANLAQFQHFAELAGIGVKPEQLNLPEHIVVVARATRSQLESSLDLLNTLAEIRSARPCHYELSDLEAAEQHEWIEEALARIKLPGDDAPFVCLLDTGINRGHPLLSPLLSAADNHTIFADGDASDSDSGTGHGTLMAGLAAYKDLRTLMLQGETWTQTHRLEGVKIFDPNRPHEPENFGAVTVQGVMIPERAAPRRNRVYSLPITAAGEHVGRPSAWSAAIDSVAFGAEEEDEPKRLILVSAGNVDALSAGPAFAYPGENSRSPVEDPAQAWNAVTVGAVTHRSRILESDPESSILTPIAPAGALSPYSRTSVAWEPHWPLKPEIVMEGGNAARHPVNGPERRDSLDLLSTSAGFHARPIAPIRATSAATALAANLAAEIQATYPDLWPETVRGLLVHSARWNEAMLAGLDPHRPGTSRDVRRLVQTYGFGEPDAARARSSFQNEVTLFRQDELTPYDGSAGAATLHDCHIHKLNLPVALLQDLGPATCTMRITLSYFTPPNPSASNRIPGSRYRYGGCLLRFRVKHKEESDANFMDLVSKEANEEEDVGDSREAPESKHDPAWALGPQLRGKSGSLVHDVWQGNAADLALMDRIAVFPVKGWWATRSFPKDSPWYRCHRKRIRYSLIVSIETMADVPLYNEISSLVSVPVNA